MDPLEFALGFAAIACITDGIDEAQKQERGEELRDDLHFSGLHETKLGLMDSDERTEALESAGLDPTDYDGFDW